MPEQPAGSAVAERAPVASPAAGTGVGSAKPARAGAWRSLIVVGAAIVAVDALWFAALAWMVSWFYAVHPPHYDSVGSFIGMFLLMHETADRGLWAGLTMAAMNSLSWYYSMYAAVAGLLLPVTPVAVVSAHLPALLLAQAALGAVVWSSTRSAVAAFLAGLLPFVPATLAGWDGGYQDPRRDPSLFLLLVATFFMGVLYAGRPGSRWAGLLFGLCAGLAIWARGNALPYVGLVMLPLGVAALLRWRQRAEGRRGVAGLLLLVLWPAVPFVLLTGAFYAATLATILDKYVVGAYGVGYDRLDSLARFSLTPISLTFDRNSLAAAGIALVAVAAAVAVGGLAVRPRRLATFEPVVMLVAGLFVAVSVMLFNTVVVGVSPLAGRWPFFPAIVGVVGILAVPLCLLAPSARPRTIVRVAAPLVACGIAAAALVGGFLDRAWKGATLQELPYAAGDDIISAEHVQTVRAVTRRLACVGGGRNTAFFWIGDVDRGLSSYYLAEENRPFLQNFEAAALVRLGIRVDLESPYVPGTDPAVRQQQILKALEAADMIVVNENPAVYEGGKVSPHFPYTHGRPIVEQILADPSLIPSFRYTLGDQRFVVLRRPEATPAPNDPACADVR